MAKCYRCGTFYSDSASSCPTCETQDLLKKNMETQKRLANEQEWRLREDREEKKRIAEKAAEEHRRITSTGWQLEAQKKAEQAGNLLNSGLNEEALKLALDAISQDPSCIRAYMMAIFALKNLGRAEEASNYLLKAIRLLQTEDHKNSLTHHHAIFLCLGLLGKPRELLQVYIDVLNNNSKAWELINLLDVRLFIAEFLKKSETEIARILINNSIQIIQKDGNTAFSIMLPLLAYDLEIDSRLGVKNEGTKLGKYLQTLDDTINSINNIQNLKKSIAVIKADVGICISEPVFNMLRGKVIERFEKVWKPQIANKKAEEIKRKGWDFNGWNYYIIGVVISIPFMIPLYIIDFGGSFSIHFFVAGPILGLLSYPLVKILERRSINKRAQIAADKIMAQTFDEFRDYGFIE